MSHARLKAHLPAVFSARAHGRSSTFPFIFKIPPNSSLRTRAHRTCTSHPCTIPPVIRHHSKGPYPGTTILSPRPLQPYTRLTFKPTVRNRSVTASLPSVLSIKQPVFQEIACTTQESFRFQPKVVCLPSMPSPPAVCS